jgi:hypothetical protein
MVVGRVIGRGGEVIKGLQRKYHATIQVRAARAPRCAVSVGFVCDECGHACAPVLRALGGTPHAQARCCRDAPAPTPPPPLPRAATTLQVEQTGDPTNITISAPPGMLQACEREIYMLINDMGPMGGPYGGPGAAAHCARVCVRACVDDARVWCCAGWLMCC